MTYRETVRVLDPIGLHARPAGQIVKAVRDSGLEVQVASESGQVVSALSALRMLAMKVKTGETIEVLVENAQDSAAQALVVQIQEFLKG
jgi:phosphotransferase system HPr (HPr) family protein